MFNVFLYLGRTYFFFARRYKCVSNSVSNDISSVTVLFEAAVGLLPYRHIICTIIAEEKLFLQICLEICFLLRGILGRELIGVEC
jgi:hypothetical protein